MKKNFSFLFRALPALVLIASLSSAPRAAQAWEPITQAGIAEEAALGANLHQRLTALGFGEGLLSTISAAGASAEDLRSKVSQLPPSAGVLLDKNGGQQALGWLVSGAMLADIYASHHFYNIFATGPKGQGFVASLADKNVGLQSAPSAIEWLTDAKNPTNLAAFYQQWAAAQTAKTRAERETHLAAALFAAGANVHLLADLGSPAHVRADNAAFRETLTSGADLGNRFERVAALAFGRVGVPTSREPVAFDKHVGFFAGGETSLAALIGKNYFSENTLPSGGASSLQNSHAKATRPLPALPTRLSLMAASTVKGTTLRNEAGVCLSRYIVVDSRISFFLDDECRLEQAAAILPVVTAYTTGFLSYLLRGNFEVSQTSSGWSLVNRGVALGAGTLTIVAEDDAGSRSVIGVVKDAKLGAGAAMEGKATAARIIVVFAGVDANGEQVVAVGAAPAPNSK